LDLNNRIRLAQEVEAEGRDHEAQGLNLKSGTLPQQQNLQSQLEKGERQLNPVALLG